MKVVSLENRRRLIPAFAVVGVLAFSLFASAPSLASSTNNCGVKGYGYHDHGKVCPNRPFPGHGQGALRQLTFASQVSNTSGSAKLKITAANSTVDATASSSTAEHSSNKPNNRSKLHGHGWGRGGPQA